MPERMSDAEALMWSVEQHPLLSSTMGAIVLLDGAPDPPRLRTTVAGLVAATPRLRQRVVTGTGRLAPPEWRADDAFDLDHHLRWLRLPPPGSMDQLRSLAAQLLADPFDRSRPLWQFVVVGGLRGRRAALVAKLHHAVADGTAAMRLAQHAAELSADAEPPEAVDLDAVFADDLRHESDATRSPVADQLRRGAGLAGRLVSEATTAMVDPTRVPQLGASALDAARAVAAQVPGGDRRTSPLWRRRSRNRRLELLALPLQPALDRAHELGGSLNDLFVTAALEGAVTYHRHHDAEPDELTVSLIVNTRTDRDRGSSNAFTPSTTVLPAGRQLSPADRFAAVSRALANRKDRARSGPGVGSLAGVAGLLPSSLTTGVALDQVGRVDFATSNVRGIPVPVWLAGQPVQALYPVGPVGGTAFNITLMSNLDQLHLGLNIDPVAVPDPALLAACVRDGFARLGVGDAGTGAGGTARRGGRSSSQARRGTAG